MSQIQACVVSLENAVPELWLNDGKTSFDFLISLVLENLNYQISCGVPIFYLCCCTLKLNSPWESDTMEGGKSKGGLATHVERKSRYLLAGKLSNKLAATYTATTLNLFALISQDAIKTMTVDNGSEFARFKEIETNLGIQVYFADPY